MWSAISHDADPNSGPVFMLRYPVPMKFNFYLTKSIFFTHLHRSSVADPVPGSGAFLTPGSGIRNRFFPDSLGSRITNPYFWELSENFLVKKFYDSLKIDLNFFLQHIKTKIIYNFVKFVATYKVMTTNFFSPLSFVAVFGSGIRDGQKSGSGIRDKHLGSATLHRSICIGSYLCPRS